MTSSHTERVAAAVRAECARKRVSQTALAESLQLSQAAVSRRLLGHTPFDVDELFRVAEVLDIPVESLVRAA